MFRCFIPESLLHRCQDIDIPRVQAAESLPNALQLLNTMADIQKCFIIGGGEVYSQAFALDELCKVHRTLVHGDFACDTFIPATLPAHFVHDTANDPLNAIKEENGVKYEFQVFVSSRHPANRSPGLAASFLARRGSSTHQPAATGRSTGTATTDHEEHQYLNLIRSAPHPRSHPAIQSYYEKKLPADYIVP
jgi:hypothetical protein